MLELYLNYWSISSSCTVDVLHYLSLFFNLSTFCITCRRFFVSVNLFYYLSPFFNLSPFLLPVATVYSKSTKLTFRAFIVV